MRNAGKQVDMTAAQSSLLTALAAAALAACSQTEPVGGSAITPPAAAGAPTQDPATRTTPVVIGRAARVFVMAGFGTNCEMVPAPAITVTDAPKQGDISFVVGQDTTIAASLQGTCAGQKAKGTGIYYTARTGASGTDRFSIAAKLDSGESSSRTFEVKIAE
jgi:hypothetical protein